VKRPRLYFSFRSPYSWMTVDRLRAALPAAHEQLDWVPYFDPDPVTQKLLAERGGEFHYTQMSRSKHRYILMDTRRLAQRCGLSMAWPIDQDCWWELPHLAWLVARRAGRSMAFYDALVAARWQRGADICTPDVIRQAATDSGVDPAAALAAPDDPDIRQEATAGLFQAYQDDVFGVPYLRYGMERFWGFDRLDAFLYAFTAANPTGRIGLAPGGAADLPAYDTDGTGGCG
jgi:2-hydroxychromene-2-carboxylate isomerase